MKKRNLRPQQAAPVARETNTNSSLVEKEGIGAQIPGYFTGDPFAGDDAE
ncbi:anacyclamide/piricyclamide family prenylated cyclic peptide [Nostoc sp. UHCC 0702]|nr:anacyclamide/piricyclamide family prenylated cyclic peptide [Nostoc sp. UHCC 0702]